MDKIWNPQAWPKPLFQNEPLSTYIKAMRFSMTTFTLSAKFVDYMLWICQEKSASIEVMQLSLSVASRYLNKNYAYNEPLQLVLLTSLYIAGKVVGNIDGSSGGFTINQLHKYSSHCFTNKDFYRIQRKILDQLQFDVMKQGLCCKQVKCMLLMLKEIISQNQYEVLCKVVQDVQIVLWHYLFTKGDKQKLLVKPENPQQQSKYFTMLTASIVQTSFILCTHCVGRFPSTVWMIHVLELKEDELSLFVQSVLRIVLGRDKFEQLKI